MAKATKEEKEEIKKRLREMIPEGTPLWGIVADVSSSGTSRSIRLLFVEAWRPRYVPPQWVAMLLGLRYDEGRHAIRVHGVGMDMVMYIIHSLSSELYDDYRALPYERIY
jgi:hypothetical protein